MQNHRFQQEPDKLANPHLLKMFSVPFPLAVRHHDVIERPVETAAQRKTNAHRHCQSRKWSSHVATEIPDQKMLVWYRIDTSVRLRWVLWIQLHGCLVDEIGCDDAWQLLKVE